jgi:hypothetical protein
VIACGDGKQALGDPLVEQIGAGFWVFGDCALPKTTGQQIQLSQHLASTVGQHLASTSPVVHNQLASGGVVHVLDAVLNGWYFTQLQMWRVSVGMYDVFTPWEQDASQLLFNSCRDVAPAL